eukprot:9470771-Pyramimonas_sp.AAC.1
MVNVPPGRNSKACTNFPRGVFYTRPKPRAALRLQMDRLVQKGAKMVFTSRGSCWGVTLNPKPALSIGDIRAVSMSEEVEDDIPVLLRLTSTCRTVQLDTGLAEAADALEVRRHRPFFPWSFLLVEAYPRQLAKLIYRVVLSLPLRLMDMRVRNVSQVNETADVRNAVAQPCVCCGTGGSGESTAV